MKNIVIIFLRFMAIVTLAVSCSYCEKWDESTVKIERFEYLDALRRSPEEHDSLLVEAYLIHNYNEKHDDKIQEIADRFVCDKIIPNERFHHARYITFFKESKNTNRENFQVRPKHKNIRARSEDKLYSYRIKERDSIVHRIAKTFYAQGAEVSFQDFYCE